MWSRVLASPQRLAVVWLPREASTTASQYSGRRRRIFALVTDQNDSDEADPRMRRKGANGVRANGATANFMFFDRGTLWVLPLTYFYLPKSARAYLFPQSVRNHYFCSGPIRVDPICPQPNAYHRVFHGGGRRTGR